MHNKKKRKKIRAITECSRTKVYTEQYQEKGVQHDIIHSPTYMAHKVGSIGIHRQILFRTSHIIIIYSFV